MRAHRHVGAVGAAHRDDGGDAAPGRRRRRRRDTQPLAGVRPGPLRPGTGRSSPTCPTRCRSWPRRWSAAGRCASPAGRRRACSPPGPSWTSWTCECDCRPKRIRIWKSRVRRAATPVLTSTCTTSASLTPSVAALAALAAPGSVSRLRGIAHLRGHETDRLAALSAEINGLGGDCRETDDGLADHRNAPARRHLARLRRSPDGDGRRDRSGCGCPASRSTTSPPPSKTLPDFPRSVGGHAGRPGVGGPSEPAAAARLRRVRRPDPAGQGVPAPHQDPARARRRAAPRWWSPSTAAAGAVCSTATPTDRSPRCGPGNWAAPRSSSATTSTSSAICPGARTRWPASCGAASAERCCAAPPMTPIPTERVVVANADQLLIVVALADPPPRTGFVDRALIAAYTGGLKPILCLTKTDLAPAGAVRRAVRRPGPHRRHRRARRPAGRGRAAAGRRAHRAARPLRGRQVDIGESPCARSTSGHRRGVRGRQGQAHLHPVGGACRCSGAAG